MSKREEQKIREELNKEVLKEFRTCIKKTSWRKYQNSMFRVESSYFFDSNFYVYLIKNKTIFKLAVKPYEADNIFWEIMQMESNKKEPLSLRSKTNKTPTLETTKNSSLSNSLALSSRILVV